jgi:Grx4 family monothiol glutaredoxin
LFNLITSFCRASWHEISKPGGQYHQIFNSLQDALSLTKVTFKTTEAEAAPEISESLEISVVPTVVAFRGSQIVGKLEGANPNELKKLAIKLENLAKMAPALESQPKISGANGNSLVASASAPAPVVVPEVKQPVTEERLKSLIGSNQVMLFMKGSPDAPRCGFSRQIVEILRKHEIIFGHFDILLDEEVRAQLKVFSDWPTYPQLYVKSVLVGGLDIVKEMEASGAPLKEQLEIEEESVFKIKSLDARLRALTNQAPIVLFMKGSPTTPRCGFSRQICELLNNESISYAYFDILGDNEVREGLKKFSDWPTYPQLYVKGTLVGGLDIVKEMKAAGPLAEQLV